MYVDLLFTSQLNIFMDLVFVFSFNTVFVFQFSTAFVYWYFMSTKCETTYNNHLQYNFLSICHRNEVRQQKMGQVTIFWILDRVQVTIFGFLLVSYHQVTLNILDFECQINVLGIGLRVQVGFDLIWFRLFPPGFHVFRYPTSSLKQILF